MPGKLRWSEEGLILMGLSLGGAYLLLGLFGPQLYFVVSPPHYMVLHSILELGAVLVSFAVFIVNWESSKQNQNAQSLFIATGFFTVAAVDTMHLLSYSGMPDFLTPNSVEKAIVYWLFARLWAAGVLWAAAHVPPSASGWYLGRKFLIGANLLACAVILVVVTFFQESLPHTYIEGVGLAPLKVYLEYSIIGVMGMALLAHLRRYRILRDEYTAWLASAMVVSILSELAFTLYSSAYDVYNLVGHLYKVIAYYMLFRGLLISSVHRPYEQLRIAKTRLEKTVAELDARNRELDALDDVAMTLSSTLKPDKVLHAAMGKIMKVMEATGGAIFFRDEDSERLRLSVWRGLPPEVVERCLSGPVLSSASASALERGRAMPIHDPMQPRSLGGNVVRIAPLRSCICAPIVSKGTLLGSLAMVGVEGRQFSARDADLLTAIGYQLGLAIENARLYESTDERLREKLAELQRAERRARFLAEVGALFGSSMDLDEVLDLVARKSAEVIGDWCAIYLLNDGDGMLHLAAAYHSDEDELKAIRQVLSRRPLPLDEGLVGRVAATGHAVLEQQVVREQIARESQYLAQSLEEIALLQQVVPTSRLAVPMKARGRTVGVLSIMSTHSHRPLLEGDLTLALELADRAGGAIDNSLLFRDSQSQRRHLEAVISQMVDGVVISDAGGRILVANAAARQMLGERTSQLVGREKYLAESISRGSGRVRTPRLPLITRALGGDLVVGEEMPAAGTNGDRVLSASAGPIREEMGSGRITGAVVVLRDVTAEREVERMKEEFMATVSHELRTPVTAVLGYTDILLRGLRGAMAPKQTEALGSIRSAGQRLLALINDLLDMSRLEAGKQELALRPVDFSLAVERSLSGVAVIASSKGINLVRSLSPNLPFVLADEEQLHRILGNLISNAIKFTPDGGEVRVSAYLSKGGSGGGKNGTSGIPSPPNHEAESVVVAVSDTGIGIPQDKQEKIWDKFQQVDSSSRRSFGGTGLGLAITKELVSLHGGTVWVESEGIAGKGSIFGFTLLVARPGDWINWDRDHGSGEVGPSLSRSEGDSPGVNREELLP